MKIVDFVRPELIIAELHGRNKAEVVAELARHMAQQQPEINAATLTRVLMEREQLASTAIGEEVAIPHGKLASVDRLLSCVGRSRVGINFDSMDGRPTHIFFVLVAPENSTGIHLKALARISRLFKDPAFRTRLLAARDAAEMYQVISEEDAKY
ncbi:MAG: PTS sugar transporter subunit IIA [Myxococcales bacterium]|nr:PTS sugar transporter subunit IIA [Myxococcota bacterium]MDW8284042.1 PTS sugar transporter subunit IIA [Myxococcales bacterium]